MEFYQTGRLTRAEANSFIRLFREKIGTEYEQSVHSPDEVTVICGDLIGNEVDKCREIESTVTGGRN